MAAGLASVCDALAGSVAAGFDGLGALAVLSLCAVPGLASVWDAFACSAVAGLDGFDSDFDSVLAVLSRCVVVGLDSVRGALACSVVAAFDAFEVLGAVSRFAPSPLVAVPLYVPPLRAATTPVLKSPAFEVAATGGLP